MSGVAVIFILFFVKILQYLNGFVLTRLSSLDQGLSMLTSIFVFVGAMFIFSVLVKKFIPRAINIMWIFVVLVLIVSSQINPSWTVTFLAGLFLYAMIGAESQVLRSIANYGNIPKFVPLILTFAPLVISYFIPQTNVATPQLIYIISSFFAFFAAYTTKFYGTGRFIAYNKAPPIWLGLFFLVGSGFLYYHSFYKPVEVQYFVPLAFVLLFYVGGTIIIYISIDEHLRRKSVKISNKEQ